jgi:two-component system, LuxR family, sensor kinase FixL
MRTKPKIESIEKTTKTFHGNRRRFDDGINNNLIIEHIADAVLIIDEKGYIRKVNNQTENLFNYAREELIGQKIEQLVPERFHQQHIKNRKGYSTNPHIRAMGIGIDLRARRKDGTEFPCSVSLSPLRNGNESYVICSLRDITESRQVVEEREKLLHDKGERVKELQCMFGVSESIQKRTTLEEIFHDVVELIPFGWHYPEITRGKIIFEEKEYVSESFKETEWKQSSDLIVNDVVKGSIEVYYLEECPELDEGPFMKEERNLINGMARNISEDIELKQAILATSESEKRYKILVENSPYGIHEIDLEGRISSINMAGLEMMGVSNVREIIGLLYTSIICQEDCERISKLMSLAYQGQESEFEFATGKGSIFYSCFVPITNKENVVIKLMGITQDITKRKQIEEEARMQRERLAHLVRVQTLGEMASGIAHEINQPLAAINSYAQASKKHLQGDQVNLVKVAELAEKISSQASRAGSIVSHLRSMMQRRPVEPKSIDINRLLNDVSKIVEVDTKHNNCNLIFKLTPSLPNVIADEILIQQVVINLIRNGVDAMDGLGDEVKKNIIVETKIKDNKELEIFVSDCGSGISSHDESNIFEAFHTTKESGLGMGLSICKSIIEEHGGNIGYLQNKAGGTTTFYFSLPVDKKEI